MPPLQQCLWNPTRLHAHFGCTPETDTQADVPRGMHTSTSNAYAQALLRSSFGALSTTHSLPRPPHGFAARLMHPCLFQRRKQQHCPSTCSYIQGFKACHQVHVLSCCIRTTQGSAERLPTATLHSVTTTLLCTRHSYKLGQHHLLPQAPGHMRCAQAYHLLSAAGTLGAAAALLWLASTQS